MPRQIDFEVELTTTPTPDDERRALLVDPGFGRLHTDHMVTAHWSADKGWYDGRLHPYGPFVLDPSTNFMHYGQSIFEGMKAYKLEDGTVTLFRPRENAARFNLSAQRLALPTIEEDDFLAAVELLVRTDHEWIPTADGASLYLRPFMMGTEVGLGVRPSADALFSVLALPSGNYFAGGIRPLKLWLAEDSSRAAPGGTGEAKCAGNYAASLVAQQAAIARGCDQVVFLDAVERRWVEELGGMNLFFVYADGRIATPALSGTILRGVTRNSIITLARDAGHEVEERRVAVDEWREGVTSGEITEVFACGTAAVVTPVGELHWTGGSVATKAEGLEGVTASLRQRLLDIQYGRAEDPYGWRVPVAL
ncbi:MAG: branched-chain amino acid aminotransferase [Mycobacteriales bacterium]|nr:branched-chain amino acid aminotransferase [Mycobacteriales bacterium]